MQESQAEVTPWQDTDMDHVTVVVLDGEEPACLTQHRLAHQLGSSLLLQEGRMLDPLGSNMCSPLAFISSKRSRKYNKWTIIISLC